MQRALPFLSQIVTLILCPGCIGAVLRSCVVYESYPNIGRGLYTNLQADGQSMTMFVDTGSPHLSLVWKTWLESAFQQGYCKDFKPGCYECPTPCEPHPPYEEIHYDEGVQTKIFQHRGSLTLAGFSFQNAILGLIMEQKPPPATSPPLSILGLSPSIDSDFPSLMDQLLHVPSSEVVHDVFALYLKNPPTVGSPCSGELLLGGGDPSLYKKPMVFAKTTDEIEYEVSLIAIKIGNDMPAISINHRALFDTGSTSMYVPQTHMNLLVDQIAARASTAAGSPVPIRFDQSEKLWVFDCVNIEYMPTIVFGLSGLNGTAPLGFTRINYATYSNGKCKLIITPETNSDLWTFPTTALIGNYIEFHPSRQLIGIARLA